MFFFPHHLPTTENLDGWWNTGPMWYIQRYTVGSQTLSEAGTRCQICCTGINKTCHFGFFKTNFGPDNIFLKLLLLLDYFCFAPFHKLCSYIIFQKMTCQHKNIFNRTVRVGTLRKWCVEPAPSNRSRHSGYGTSVLASYVSPESYTDTTLQILQMGRGQTLSLSSLELSLQKWNPMCCTH